MINASWVRDATKPDRPTSMFRVQEGTKPIQARILIGADGYFSRVRECMLGDRPPTFRERVSWRTRVAIGPGLPDVNEIK
jgi:2-polyprenyl-6-methoxyphenol hydroxylase-like FAD-dependent oxidoreductase